MAQRRPRVLPDESAVKGSTLAPRESHCVKHGNAAWSLLGVLRLRFRFFVDSWDILSVLESDLMKKSRYAVALLLVWGLDNRVFLEVFSDLLHATLEGA